MTYPPQGDNSGQDAYGQSPYGQESYGQYGHAQSGYGTQAPSYASQGGFAENPAGRPGPPSNVGWAVASILFFWPLAFVAMTRALDVYPLWASGRHTEAEAASASAKKLGIISIVVFLGLFVLYFVFIFAMVGLTASGF